ncbi:MAG: hypothetical protein QNJ51_18295 [Calothrix sp. MO_167.B12]|nr:hypothetical protein [Calothrix sp. MO_167.B12]
MDQIFGEKVQDFSFQLSPVPLQENMMSGSVPICLILYGLNLALKAAINLSSAVS